MFYHSNDLDSMASKKADEGCRQVLKRSADVVKPCGDHAKIISAYEIANANGHLRPEMTLTIVGLNQVLLFFYKDLETTTELIKAARPEIKGEVPKAVLIKMAALRLSNLVKEVKQHNYSQLQSYKWMVESYNKDPKNHFAPVAPVAINIPDLRTVESIRDFIKSNPKVYQIRHMLPKFEKDLFSKSELTDNEISSAMDQVIIGLVSEE